jgi:hypothetical protein
VDAELCSFFFAVSSSSTVADDVAVDLFAAAAVTDGNFGLPSAFAFFFSARELCWTTGFAFAAAAGAAAAAAAAAAGTVPAPT